MYAMTAVVLFSLLISLLLTPFFRDLFGFLGMLDTPDAFRKIHRAPIPRAGGVAFTISYTVALVLILVMWLRSSDLGQDPTILLMLRLLPALLLMFAVGFYDDVKGLTAFQKLAGQAVAAGYACVIGVHPVLEPGLTINNALVCGLSVGWLVFSSNAFNLIDGLDGLAAGVGILAAGGLFVSALLNNQGVLAMVIAPIFGALLGFLYYNFNPATVFLGDCGSLLVGFLLGCYGVMWNQHPNSAFGMISPAIALAVPIVEVVLSIARRFLRKRPIFGADRNHMHHRIVDLGLSHRNAALILYAVSAFAAFLAVLHTVVSPRRAIFLSAIVVAAGIAGIRALRYSEFRVVGRILRNGEFLTALRTQILLEDLASMLRKAESVAACWMALRTVCADAHFDLLALRFHEQCFEEQLSPVSTGARRIHVTLLRGITATFGYDPQQTEPSHLIAPIAELLQDRLSRFEPTSEQDSDAVFRNAVAAG